MKTKLLTSLLLLTCSIGCSNFPLKKEFKPQEMIINVPGVTNVIQEGTNVTIQIVPPHTITNVITNVTWSVSKEAEAIISAAKELNATINPTPSAPLINTGLGALAGLLALIATYLTKKANKSDNLLTTIIGAVEAADNKEVKSLIEKMSVASGNSKELDKKVQDTVK